MGPASTVERPCSVPIEPASTILRLCWLLFGSSPCAPVLAAIWASLHSALHTGTEYTLGLAIGVVASMTLVTALTRASSPVSISSGVCKGSSSGSQACTSPMRAFQSVFCHCRRSRAGGLCSSASIAVTTGRWSES